MISWGDIKIGLAAFWEFCIKGDSGWGPPPEDTVQWKPGYHSGFRAKYKGHELDVIPENTKSSLGTVPHFWWYLVDGVVGPGKFDTAEEAEDAAIFAVDKL